MRTTKLFMVGLLAACLSVPGAVGPALAQADLFLGILGTAIQEGARQQQQNQRIQRQQSIQREQARRAREAQIAEVKRIQSALQALGFYTMAIDGDAGPGTRRAIATYLNAFGLSDRPLSSADIATLERRAAAGFRSAQEEARARSGGFATRTDLERARRGGFANARDYAEARSFGIADARELDAFRRSGFSEVGTFRRARDAGFAERREYDAAQRAGFVERDEYVAFVASGEPDRASWVRAKEVAAARRESVALCRRHAAARDWIEAAPACELAAAIAPGDADVQVALSTATRQLDVLAVAGQAELAKLERELDALRETARNEPGAAAALETLADRVAETEGAVRRAARARTHALCVSASETGRWESAAEACRATAAVRPGDVALARRIQAAETALEEERRAAEGERRRLALETARRDARALIADIEAFSGSDGAFADGIAIARGVVALRSVLDSDRAEAIEQARAALGEILASETAYERYVARSREAELETRANAFAEARRTAERLEGFVRDYVARNVMSEHVPDLIDLQERLDAALRTDDADGVLSAQKLASERIDALGLAAEAAAFRLDPAASAADLADRGAASARERLALERAIARGEETLATIDDFAKGGGRFEDGLAVARGVAALKRARDGGSADLEAAQGELDRVLQQQAGYADFARRRTERLAAAANDTRVTATAQASAIESFVRAHLSENPLSPDLQELLALQGDLASALETGDTELIFNAHALATETLGVLGLAPAAEAYVARHVAGGESRVVTADNGLAVTALNRAVMEGDARDVLILRNASGIAPNLVTNLRGELVFEGARAAVCWRHAQPERTLSVKLALAQIRTLGATRIAEERCPPGSPLGHDLVLIERGAFLGEDPTYAEPLVRAFEEGDLAVLELLAWTAVSERTAADADAARTIAEEARAGVRSGWGLIALDGGSDALCLVRSGAPGDAQALAEERRLHDTLLASRAGDLDLHLPGVGALVAYDPERAFVRTQRGECGALYAEAAELGLLLEALDRDGLAHATTPIWFSPDEVAGVRARLAAQRAEQMRAYSERRQAREGEAELDRQKRESAEQLRLRRQAALRDTYAQEARAAFNDIETLADGQLQQTDGRGFASLFPEVAGWHADHRGDLWEVTAHALELVDYGTAAWRDRRTEAVIALLSIESRNRTLGAYADTCFVIGYLVDDEFEMRRDPIEAPCDSHEAALDAWMLSRDFQSRWIAPGS